MGSEKTNNSQEIDLSLVYKKVSSSFGRMIYNIVRFTIKNAFIIIGLIVIGAVIGYFLDSKKSKVYKHEVILALNFDSSEFLYNKIKNLDKDEFPEINSAEIEPVIDLLSFINEKWENLRTAEFMSENNISIHQYKKGNQSEKIYRYHILTLTSTEKDLDGSVVSSFLDKINKEPYYLNRKNIETENTALQIAEYEKSIEDLNKIFERLGTPDTVGSNGIKIETQDQTNDLLNSKQGLIDKINRLKIIQSEQGKVFYDLTRITNIKGTSKLYMIGIPLLLVFLLLTISYLKNIYKKYQPDQI